MEVQGNCPDHILAKYVRFLAGSFRLGDAEDGEVLSAGLTALLGSYPEWVVRAVCDPRSGLPSTSKFFPTLYEVRVACEQKLRPVIDAERRRQREEDIQSERPVPASPEELARRKVVVDEWRQRMEIQEMAVAGRDLSEMDARKCQGEMKARIEQAIDAKLANLTASCATADLRLPDWVLRKVREPASI